MHHLFYWQNLNLNYTVLSPLNQAAYLNSSVPGSVGYGATKYVIPHWTSQFQGQMHKPVLWQWSPYGKVPAWSYGSKSHDFSPSFSNGLAPSIHTPLVHQHSIVHLKKSHYWEVIIWHRTSISKQNNTTTNKSKQTWPIKARGHEDKTDDTIPFWQRPSDDQANELERNGNWYLNNRTVQRDHVDIGEERRKAIKEIQVL